MLVEYLQYKNKNRKTIKSLEEYILLYLLLSVQFLYFYFQVINKYL